MQSEESDGSNLLTHSTVYSDDRKHRLKLILKKCKDLSWGMDFHSIVWEFQRNDGWAEIVAITQEEFELEKEADRWIADVESFSPETSTAIIRVGHEQPEVTSGNLTSRSSTYSWREWDLSTNQEVKFLQECQPCAKFIPPAKPETNEEPET